MELPMRALRSKDFPQDRQTKLQNTLTPLFLSLSPTPLPSIHYCPRNTSLQSTLVDSVSFLTQFFFTLFSYLFFIFSLFHSFVTFGHHCS